MYLVDFSDWITGKYIEWRGNKIKDISIAEFARLFGASQPVVSDWMKKGGRIPRNKKYINALIEKYGLEAYIALGLTTPDNYEEVLQFQEIFPPSLRKRLLSAQREIESEYRRRRINAETPEAEEIAIEIMGRHGFKYIKTNVLGEPEEP
jgi:hypothetical protein